MHLSLRVSVRLSCFAFFVAAAACGRPEAAEEAVSGDGAQALSSSNVKAQIVAIARGLTGERGPFVDKAYWLDGKASDGTACRVTLSRNDDAFVEATISTIGSNPPADMGFSLFASNPAATPVVNVDATTASLKAAVAVKSDGYQSENGIEADFDGSGGYAGLRSVRIYSETQSAGHPTAQVGRSCSGLEPLLTVDSAAQGPALTNAARAYYEQKHGTKLADPVVFRGCGFGDANDRIDCSFDVGNGNDDKDIPPDQLDVDFSVAAQKIGAPVSASLNGE